MNPAGQNVRNHEQLQIEIPTFNPLKGAVMNRLLAIAAILLIFPAVSHAQNDILSTAASNGSFKTLVSLVVAADLDEALQGKGDFTVFAPTDEAFAKLPKETLKSLLKPENRDQLANILKYHVLPKEISVAKRAPSHPLKSAKTLLGKPIRFERKGNQLEVNGTKVITRNIKCSNGLIQVIDGVLLPPADEDKTIIGVAKKAGSFKTLLAAVEAAGLNETLTGKGPFTVFAPTDKAFAALPKGTLKELLKAENKDQLTKILTYHVVSGKVTAKDAINAGKAKTIAHESVTITIKDGRLQINEAGVISNDIEASNGIIHVIDQVLLPAKKSTPTVKRGSQVTITSDWDSPVTRDGIEADKIIIRCGGAGKVRLTNVKAKSIETRIGGGGSVSIDGNAEEHNATVSGGAVLRARNLVSSNTEVQVNGGGDAEVHATKSLIARANGGATLRYVKTAAKISKSINQYANFGPISKSH